MLFEVLLLIAVCAVHFISNFARTKRQKAEAVFDLPFFKERDLNMQLVSAEDPAVTRFREYLRIKTVQPTPDYKTCREFLGNLCKNIAGLELNVFECVPGKPIILMTWPGSDPSLSSIILNSHMDVVPVFEDKWTLPPFAAEKRPNGDIVARGTQDMKCVGMSYVEAVMRLRNRGIQLKRTIHILFVPDEEIGGHDGMEKFVKTQDFKNLNAGVVLDEGLANEENAYKVYYGERAPWWVKISATGSVGHGSQFIPNTAASKLHKMINKLLAFRDSEEMRLKNGFKDDGFTPLTIGDVTTVNMTKLGGGVQINVVPDYLEACFDIRISPFVDLSKFRVTLENWCKEADCKLEFIQFFGSNPVTQLKGNKWWECIQNASLNKGVVLQPEVFPAATDSRYVRDLNIPAIGVSPIKNTKILLHDHDEYLNEKVYLDGIAWYEDVIHDLGNLSRA